MIYFNMKQTNYINYNLQKLSIYLINFSSFVIKIYSNM